MQFLLEKAPRLSAYPAVLKQFLVFALQNLARATRPYICDGETARLIAGHATDDVVDTAFAALKSQLAFMGSKFQRSINNIPIYVCRVAPVFVALILMKILGIVLMVLLWSILNR